MRQNHTKNDKKVARIAEKSLKRVKSRVCRKKILLLAKKIVTLQMKFLKKSIDMTTQELEKFAELCAKRTASIVMKQLQELRYTEANDMVDSKEAARILGITPNYLRSIKDRFPHIKVGDSNQSRIFFKKSDLLAIYTR